MRKFRDTIAADRDVFLCPDEFAEVHDLNGQQVSADDQYSFGSNIETRKYYEMYGSHVTVSCKEEDLEEVPVYGQTFRLDGKLYTVAESKTDLGIVTLILVANDM